MMKTILVCTDFSDAARNACFYAATLADSLKARLVLISAYQMEPVVVSDISTVTATPEELRELNVKQLEHEVTRLHLPIDLQVATSSREGVPVRSILAAAKEWQADVIVAGMKTSGKNIRRIFGSTVTGLVRKSNVPLIVVPENTTYEKPVRIALAWESDAVQDTDPSLLKILKELGEKFDAALFLVHVSRNQYREAFAVLNRPFRLQRMLKTLQPELENIHGKDLGEVMAAFIRENDIKMMALLPHKKSLLERMFMASATRQLVFEVSVPILVLPGIAQERK